MNMSANYRNITPLIVPKEDEDDHMNIPFYFLEAAGKDTCKYYDKENEDVKKKIAKYEF